ncbi:hypothetical protein [Sulfuracidifex tepidarius]|uniref:Thioredoxin domain-containing protein n=1 Tax=Sulfuracidifex tepidarius TaxID=1294262 RepID=A0A510E2J9_9CREN|nr:hypothetical protein [Sulfuracidifex tepidarius]BBG23979.1 hypothetical protein IC006_1280 [Sulfuracidifex tepidarius]BBG26734.1 hypothetical protein IC007_1255 [Sulfuracidifex tepidarius]
MAKKLILVTTESHPMHKLFLEITDEVSKEVGIESEVRKEDYAFVTDYGEKDEFGMPWLPQLFLQEDGSIKPILTSIPFNDSLKPDKEKAKLEALSKVKNS